MLPFDFTHRRLLICALALDGRPAKWRPWRACGLSINAEVERRRTVSHYSRIQHDVSVGSGCSFCGRSLRVIVVGALAVVVNVVVVAAAVVVVVVFVFVVVLVRVLVLVLFVVVVVVAVVAIRVAVVAVAATVLESWSHNSADVVLQE